MSIHQNLQVFYQVVASLRQICFTQYMPRNAQQVWVIYLRWNEKTSTTIVAPNIYGNTMKIFKAAGIQYKVQNIKQLDAL